MDYLTCVALSKIKGIFIDVGSKYHKINKMIKNDPSKKFYPYRPSLAGYDKSYKSKYNIDDF